MGLKKFSSVCLNSSNNLSPWLVSVLTMRVRSLSLTKSVTLRREAMKVQPVQFELKREMGKNIGYIALSQFTPNASGEMYKAVKELLNKNVDGFILDLRNNPGGLLKTCTEIASMFLHKEQVGGMPKYVANGTRCKELLKYLL